MMKRVEIIGVPISVVNMESTIDTIINNMEKAKTSYICVSNVHTTVMARENDEYRKVIANSFLTLPDGKPLSVIAKKKGFMEIEQVRGVDLMKQIFSKEGYNHYFYGNTQENLNILINTLAKEYQNLNIVGYEPSIFKELTNSELFQLSERVKESKADFLWVGLGAPLQEIFCERIKGTTDAIPIGVGGAFNVLAHIVPDAPQIMKKLGLEWVYRLTREPKRLFKRYFLTNIKFICYLIGDNKGNERNNSYNKDSNY